MQKQSCSSSSINSLTITNAHTHRLELPTWDPELLKALFPENNSAIELHYSAHRLPTLLDVKQLIEAREDITDQQLERLQHFSALGFYPQLVSADERYNQAGWERLTVLLQHFLWIGETGIDLRFKDTLEQQHLVLSWHLEWAKKHHQGLVIHQVRGLDHISQLLKKINFTGPVLWHHLKLQQVRQLSQSFTGSQQLFSFGPTTILNLNSPEQKMLFRAIWEKHREQILLETDDLPAEQLLGMFGHIAKILEQPASAVVQQIAHNFNRWPKF